jgi:hypothetical protein
LGGNASGCNYVIKINDGVYYATWTEYFNSLVIHNLLFPGTAYELLGFTSGKEGTLCAVLKQPFIEGDRLIWKISKNF